MYLSPEEWYKNKWEEKERQITNREIWDARRRMDDQRRKESYESKLNRRLIKNGTVFWTESLQNLRSLVASKSDLDVFREESLYNTSMEEILDALGLKGYISIREEKVYNPTTLVFETDVEIWRDKNGKVWYLVPRRFLGKNDKYIDAGYTAFDNEKSFQQWLNAREWMIGAAGQVMNASLFGIDLWGWSSIPKPSYRRGTRRFILRKTVIESLKKVVLKGTEKEMLGQAIGQIKLLPKNPAQRAAAFEFLAKQITSKYPHWQAVRSLGSDGSVIFLGRQGEALIINSSGKLFRGSLSKGLSITKKGITPNYKYLIPLD